MFQNAEFKAIFFYSSRKIALKTTRDGEKSMTHGSVNIFFKLLLKSLLKILHFGTNYSHRIVHMYRILSINNKDRCSDFNQQRPPLAEGGLPVEKLYLSCKYTDDSHCILRHSIRICIQPQVYVHSLHLENCLVGFWPKL